MAMADEHKTMERINVLVGSIDERENGRGGDALSLGTTTGQVGPRAGYNAQNDQHYE
jgi:hypothetical protein